MSDFPFDGALWDALSAADRTTRELAIRELGDHVEFHQGWQPEALAEVVEALIDQVVDNTDAAVQALALRVLDDIGRRHPAPDGGWPVDLLEGFLQFGDPALHPAVRQTLARLGSPMPSPPAQAPAAPRPIVPVFQLIDQLIEGTEAGQVEWTEDAGLYRTQLAGYTVRLGRRKKTVFLVTQRDGVVRTEEQHKRLFKAAPPLFSLWARVTG